MQHPISLHAPPGREVAEGERVTVRVSSREPVRARLADDPAPGFRVAESDLEDALADAETAVATSRHGRTLTVSRLADVRDRTRDTHVAVAFGSPGRGLPDVLGIDPEEVPVDPDATDGSGFDLWLNAIPRQGSEVVRTEEAIFAALSPLTLTE
jgi:predicted SPOUT superfamily RNA methylase MTH1